MNIAEGSQPPFASSACLASQRMAAVQTRLPVEKGKNQKTENPETPLATSKTSCIIKPRKRTGASVKSNAHVSNLI
jgi:hypothetical protein